jgi:hypothetical protein
VPERFRALTPLTALRCLCAAGATRRLRRLHLPLMARRWAREARHPLRVGRRLPTDEPAMAARVARQGARIPTALSPSACASTVALSPSACVSLSLSSAHPVLTNDSCRPSAQCALTGCLHACVLQACLNQDNIRASLDVLPIYLASCSRFIVVLGPTYLSRIWVRSSHACLAVSLLACRRLASPCLLACPRAQRYDGSRSRPQCCVECFTFLRMGGDEGRTLGPRPMRCELGT